MPSKKAVPAKAPAAKAPAKAASKAKDPAGAEEYIPFAVANGGADRTKAERAAKRGDIAAKRSLAAFKAHETMRRKREEAEAAEAAKAAQRSRSAKRTPKGRAAR